MSATALHERILSSDTTASLLSFLSFFFAFSNSEFVRLLTKTRHYNITCIIAIQTIRFVHLNVKRLATDIVVYSGFSKEDFEAILNQTNNNVDKKKTVDEYLNLQDKHDKFIMNLSAGKYYFEQSD